MAPPHSKTILAFTGLLLSSGILAAFGANQAGSEARYKTETNLLYREGAGLTEAMQEHCRLDLYFPENTKGFATVVWFHGGGLTEGTKSVPEQLKGQGLAVVAVEYRLSPAAKSPAYVEDAAAAVAWTFKHIEEYGGSSKLIFVSGGSAGGYLTSMIGLDKRWLAAFGVDADRIAGLIPFSGQAITHFTVRAERGMKNTQPVIDDMAPLFHVRKDAPPLVLITGDRELELLGRYEENAYLWRMMKIAGHPNTSLYELQGFNHGEMSSPAHDILLRFVRKTSQQARADESKKTGQ